MPMIRARKIARSTQVSILPEPEKKFCKRVFTATLRGGTQDNRHDTLTAGTAGAASRRGRVTGRWGGRPSGVGTAAALSVGGRYFDSIRQADQPGTSARSSIAE